MNRETQRQQYLEEMGISTYYSRFRLPGAAASPRWPEDETGGAPSPTTRRAPAKHGVAGGSLDESSQPSASSANDALQLLDTKKESAPAAELARPQRAAVAAQSVTDTSGPASQQVARIGVEPFAFSWYGPDARLAVLVELPAGQRGRPDRASRDLLANMLRAVDEAYASTPLTDHPFAWPFDPADREADADAARQAVQGFARRRLRSQPARYLLVCADQWPAYLVRDEAVGEGFLKQADLGLQMLRIPSLPAMAQDRARKKEAWQQLQRLIPALREIRSDTAGH